MAGGALVAALAAGETDASWSVGVTVVATPGFVVAVVLALAAVGAEATESGVVDVGVTTAGVVGAAAPGVADVATAIDALGADCWTPAGADAGGDAGTMAAGCATGDVVATTKGAAGEATIGCAGD
jgi:hypothetical protein